MEWLLLHPVLKNGDGNFSLFIKMTSATCANLELQEAQELFVPDILG